MAETLQDLGLNKELYRDDVEGDILGSQDSGTTELQSENLISGEIDGDLSIVGGFIQSKNFVTSSTGWRIDAEGNFEANAGTFRGSLIAGSIDIPDTTTANSFHVDGDGNMWSGATTFGSATFSVSKAGLVTATSGVIGGFTITSTTISGGTKLVLDSTGEGIITTGTLRSAASGTRFQITDATQRYEIINANGDVNATMNWSSTTAAILRLRPIHDARRALEIVIPSSFAGTGNEIDAKAITIDNAADSVTIDITDGGLVGVEISTCDDAAIKITGTAGNSAILITAASTNDATLNFDFTSSVHPVIEIEQTGTFTNSYGIRITQGAAAVKEAIFIDDNADSHLSESIYIDRDGNATPDVHAMLIQCANAGSGRGVGINLTGVDSAFTFSADATDPTGGGGAATGRIPIEIGGTTVYLAYY